MLFRAAYGKIGQLRGFVHYPFLCLTATSGKETRRQIVKTPHKRDVKLVKISTDKPNSKFVVREKLKKLKIAKRKEKGISKNNHLLQNSFKVWAILYFIHLIYSHKNWMILSAACLQCIIQRPRRKPRMRFLNL